MIKFSIAHSEKNQENYPEVFYELCKNTSKETLNDLEDLYFGKFFYYSYKGNNKRYGNCMGVESTDEAIDYLFKIQDEFGVTISLTMNALDIPIEMQLDGDIISEFLDWIETYYVRGLRSITLANTHLVKSGQIKKRFPLLRIKNTVNHLVSDAQQVVDYAHLGYNTILLDRSLNRNFKELKIIKKAVDMLNAKGIGGMPIKTSLLVAEGCLYKCPFKKEHDSLGSSIGTDYFKTLSTITCDKWRNPLFSKLPRNVVNLYTTYTETFNKIAEYVDILKFSGRLIPLQLETSWIREHKAKFIWLFNGADEFAKNAFVRSIIKADTLMVADTFNDILKHNAAPIHLWTFSYGFGDMTKYYVSDENYKRLFDKYMSKDVWFSEEGQKLEKTLQNCRSQCWDCHKCERAYGMPDIDSALEI